MSYYITCVKEGGVISASINPPIALASKYEVALVEAFFPSGLKFEKGLVRLYNTESKSVISILNLNNVSSIEGLIKYSQSLAVPTDLNGSHAVLKAGENQIFKLTEEAQKILNIDAEYTPKLTIEESVFTKSNAAHLYCNIISEQIYGKMRRPILRSLKFPIQHHIFSSPHYVDVNATCLTHINISVRDDRFNEIKVVGNPILKLHLRLKK